MKKNKKKKNKNRNKAVQEMQADMNEDLNVGTFEKNDAKKSMSKRKKVILSVLGCLVIVGAAGGGYWLYEQYTTPDYMEALKPLAKEKTKQEKLESAKSVLKFVEQEHEKEKKENGSDSKTDDKSTSKKEKATDNSTIRYKNEKLNEIGGLNPEETIAALKNGEITEEDIQSEEPANGGKMYTEKELERMMKKRKAVTVKITDEEKDALLKEAKPFVKTIQEDDRGFKFSKDFLKTYEDFKKSRTDTKYQELKDLLNAVEVSLYNTEYYEKSN